MTLIELQLEQGSEEWLAARRGMVTASVVGQLLTPTLKVADNDTSRAVIATLAAERISGWTDETPMTSDMWRGVEHEPFARDRYAEHNKVTVKQVGFMVRDDWGFRLGASPDGLIGDDGGLEIKCPRSKTHIRTIIADQVPAHYMAQVQACLLVSDRKWWDFASFCAGLPMWTKRVYPDARWQEAIVAACTAAESSIGQLIEDYAARADGLPMTDRIAEYGEIEAA